MKKLFYPFTGMLAYALEKISNPFVKREININEVKNIAVVLLQGIGNTVLFLPALDMIEKNFPRSKIFIIASKENRELLSTYKNFILMEYPSKMNFLSRMRFLLKTRKNNFDLVIYGYPNMDIWPTILCVLMGGYRLLSNYTVGFYDNCDFLNNKSIGCDWEKSDVTQNIKMIQAMNIKTENFDVPKLKVPKDAEEKSIRYLRAAGEKVKICIHIGAGVPIKKWPAEHFAELTNLIVKKYGYSVVLIGGKSEETELKDYLKYIKVSIINLVGKLSVIETAAVIKKCDVLVSNDSGPMHIGTAVGTRVIALYGPSTGVIRTQPVAKNSKVLTLKLPCSPCISAAKMICPLGTHFCLKGLEPQTVLDEIRAYVT